MLGFYEGFPKNVHKIIHFTTMISNRKLQQTLINAFNETNSKALDQEEINNPLGSQYNAIFEFGIADANNFNYLDTEEVGRVLKVLKKNPFQVMDFFGVLCYYKITNGRKIPLKFDYYLIRFKFNKKMQEIHIFHERGPRYISPEDVAEFIIDRINKSSSKKILNVFKS